MPKQLYSKVFSCRFGTRIHVEMHKPRNAEQELAEDLVTIITSFAAKIHDSRSYTKRKDPNLPESESVRHFSKMGHFIPSSQRRHGKSNSIDGVR